MNIFYAPPEQVSGDIIELTGQEAIHATRALRYKEGDDITVVDGKGGWYEGQIQLISGKKVRIVKKSAAAHPKKQPQIILGIGIIKKRDRLEFAVEKAVELGVKEIALFRSEHTIKKNPRMDRLKSIVLSAMKQSLQAWLPEISLHRNPAEILQKYPDSNLIVAHETEEKGFGHIRVDKERESLLLVGPEGGFSEKEIAEFEEKEGQIVSLGASRLRTETAAITMVNQFNYFWSLANVS